MEVLAHKNSLTYSLADQSFARTKSVGILNVSVDLLQVLAQQPRCPRLTVLANRSLLEKLKLPAATRTELHDGASGGGLGRIWWDQFGAYAAARRTGNEWLLLPKGFASFVRRCPVRLAAFVHDVVQDHYDRHYPDAVPRLEAAYFRASFRASLRQAKIIFTPTEFTRREVERVAREKGWTVPRLVCCGEGFDRPATWPPSARRDIIVNAHPFPQKLTRRAVEFLSRWHQENPFTEFIHWVGLFPEKLELPARPGWQRRGRLPEAEFRALMSQVRAVLYFSDYEGFGRPPVEAALAGAVPVFSNIPATREVMGGCGCPFDNADYESFAAALRRALTTTPEQLRVWADQLLARHNWDDVANRILTALDAA
jgi:glycosyltransferase involved in cell wall biosynthesis